LFFDGKNRMDRYISKMKEIAAIRRLAGMKQEE
jgi:hypothetical protein